MPPERDHPGSVRDWLRHANSDLELARMEPPSAVLLEALCFHAQQAAEKSIKAVLLHHSISFPRTHSIRMLLDLLDGIITIPEEIQNAAMLTDYAVMARYPGATEPVDEEECGEAVQFAETVVLWAERIINS